MNPQQHLIVKKRKNEQLVKKRIKVDPYIQLTLEEIEKFANDTPFLFVDWVLQNGHHKRICMRSDDLEKFRFINRFMRLREENNKKTIFATNEQLKLL
ncbi:MAG: hypothetical protein EBW68_05860 [Actinobacteria bacterium]|nr:hypothetical protein [Actinomycetota bacterium]